jgi:oligoribonuclease NrnB/cAMP/cGMP phosphodiesterase (DHH superfamily)
MFNRIITHNDLDGVVSASIISLAMNIDYFFFTTPLHIYNGRVLTTANDVVCDLPYPAVCGVWFDHHKGNFEELNLRGIKIDDIKGLFLEEPSCARVVYKYFRNNNISLPDFMEDTVERTDIVDGFLYRSIEDWRANTPEHIINKSMRITEDRKSKDKYLLFLVREIRKVDFESLSRYPNVVQRANIYDREEENMLKLIEKHISFIDDDENKEIIVLDFTNLNHIVKVFKSLAFLFYPKANAVIEIKNVFRNAQKTNELLFSMSFSIAMNNKDHKKDIGEIMRKLNIGDGHRGAASGTVKCSSKKQMLKEKERFLYEIFSLWKKM